MGTRIGYERRARTITKRRKVTGRGRRGFSYVPGGGVRGWGRG